MSGLATLMRKVRRRRGGPDRGRKKRRTTRPTALRAARHRGVTTTRITARAPVRVRAAHGIVTIEPTLDAEPYDLDAVSPKARPFLAVAAAIRCTVPKDSARSMHGTVTAFRAFLEWAMGDANACEPKPEWVIAYVVARCAPPVGEDLPRDERFRRPVLPTTAAGDVDELRRAARKGTAFATTWLNALNSDEVATFVRECGGRVKKLRTNKRPFLFAKVQEAWSKWGCDAGGAGAGRGMRAVQYLRDATAIVLGFFYGCRSKELAQLRMRDVRVTRDRVSVTFRERKNVRSVMRTHDPQTIAASHALLLKAVCAWLKTARAMGAKPEDPLFPAVRGQRTLQGAKALSKSTFRSICKRIDPECVAHSLRAGMATEAWAAGVPLEAIMALGGWSSPVAVMYIVGATDETCAASRKIGTASMRYEADELRASLGTGRLQRAVWTQE